MGVVAKRVQSSFVNTDTKGTEPNVRYTDIQLGQEFVTSEPAIDKVCLRRISSVYGILNGAP